MQGVYNEKVRNITSEYTSNKTSKTKQLPSDTLLFDDEALQERNWRDIVSSTAFSNDKHFSSPSPLKGRPYAMVNRSSS